MGILPSGYFLLLEVVGGRFALGLVSYFYRGTRTFGRFLPSAYFRTFRGYACFWAFCPRPIFILLSGMRAFGRFALSALSLFSYFYRVKQATAPLRECSIDSLKVAPSAYFHTFSG